MKFQQLLSRCRNCGHTLPAHVQQKDSNAKTMRNLIILPKFVGLNLQVQANQKSHKCQKPDTANQIVTDPNSSSGDEYMYAMNIESPVSKVPTVLVQISGTTVSMIIDTGASIDILDEATYNKAYKHNNILLTPSLKRLFAYGSATQLKVLISFRSLISIDDAQCISTFHVLSYATAAKLAITS